MRIKNIDKLLTKIIIMLIVILTVTFIENELAKNSHANINNDVKEVIDGSLELYFFDVGEADSILIKENEFSMLIDAGNNDDGNNLVNYLKNDIGIDKIDIVVGTHPHEDHIGGLDDIINAFSIGKIYLPNIITTSKTFNDVLDSIKYNNLSISIPKKDEIFELGDLVFKVISVDNNELNLNDSSIVLRLDYGNTSYLFTGDISKSVEKELLDNNINVDLLKIAHHGSNYSTSKKFLDKVNPKYAIISVGKNNPYNHPCSSVLRLLNNRGIKVYRTDKSGTIKIISDGNNIEVEEIKTNIDG